jgi:ketosteroid isomerase-like protein
MDRIINQHFAFEVSDDVNGFVESLAKGAEHEIVPSPFGRLSDRSEIRRMYELLFRDLKGKSVAPVRRLIGDDFVVDEAVWHGHIAGGRPFHLHGHSGKASFRLLHIFEFRDGRIAREDVWCDFAAIQKQLGCAPSGPGAADASAVAHGGRFQ